MILKVRRAKGNGWVLRDNLGKVDVNQTDWYIQLKGEDDFEIFHRDAVEPMNYSSLNVIEFDKSVPQIDGKYPCCCVCATLGYMGNNEREILIIANTPMYLLNDNGKTIESL